MKYFPITILLVVLYYLHRLHYQRKARQLIHKRFSEIDFTDADPLQVQNVLVHINGLYDIPADSKELVRQRVKTKPSRERVFLSLVVD